MKPSLKFQFLIPVLLLVFAGLAAAQDQYSDPPTRVARLQFTEGQVSLQPGGVDDWAVAAVNRPLTTADRLWVDRDSRAELSLGSTALRMQDETSISFTNLGDNVAQVELDQGTLEVSVRYLNQEELVEIDTPNIAFTANEPGDYRIDVNPDEDRTWVTVRHGSGTATGQQASALLERGQLYEFSNGQSGEYTVADAMPRDDFESWCFQRERRERESISLRYVAPGTIGYAALDDAGDWEPMPTYGAVWFPRVDVRWAPYHDGHWIWVEPWGWTWVDDEPWGFAPFHYGRWAFIGSRWGWIPGPREVRPVYAPALVAWIGGPSFSVSIGIGGGVGWVPLGWHDPYIPNYHVSPRYAEQVNISNSRVVNTTIVNNYYSTTNVNVRNTTINNIHYENVRVQNAVTVVPSNALASGRQVQQVAVKVQPQQIMRVTVSRGPAVVPTKQAVLGPRPAAAAPARFVAPKQVVARTPPPPPPVSFEKQRPLLQQQKGMPLPPQQRMQLRQTTPVAPARPQPAVVTVKPTTPKAPPMANKQATPPKPPAAANVPPRPGAPGAPGMPGRPAQPEAMTPGRPAPPAARPGTPSMPQGRETMPGRPGTPVVPQGREVMPGRPGTPAAPAAPQGREVMPGRPAAPPAGRESTTPERPTSPATPASPAERPGFGGRPAPPQERGMERPMPPTRPAPQERTMMPNQPSRPAPEERGMAPSRPMPPSRPAPQERTMERPAPPSRPAPQERTMERPAPPSRPAPQERTMERPAQRPATPPAREVAPELQRKTPPPKENPKEQKDQKDKYNLDR